MEGNRSWWIGWASNPVSGATRRWAGSTPVPFRPALKGPDLRQPEFREVTRQNGPLEDWFLMPLDKSLLLA